MKEPLLHSHPPGRRRSLLWPVMMTFLTAMLLGVWKNDFPFYWHVDEPGKARQILTGERNLHHPLLLLTTTDAVVRGLGLPPDPQQVTEAGRWVSAVFSALAVALLSWIVGRSFGVRAAWIAGLLAATHWNIFELAHYFKEDPALAFGLMASLAAMTVWRSRPVPLSGALLGAAVALAVSGKYVGVIALILPPLAWWKHPPQNGRLAPCVWAAAAGFVVVVLMFNWPMLTHGSVLKASIAKETTGVLQGGVIATHHVFHFGFFDRMERILRIALWPGVIFFLLFAWRHFRAWPLEIKMLAGLPVFFAVLLGFSQKDSGRYFLPGVFALCAVAAIGWHLWLEWTKDRQTGGKWVPWITAVAALTTVAGATERLVAYGDGFLHNSREDMGLWLREHLPPDAVVAQSADTKLPDPDYPRRAGSPRLFAQKLVTLEDLPRRYTLEDLRKQGITHLAATEHEWRRYLNTAGRTSERAKKHFDRQRAFWRSLNRHGKVVWQCEAGKLGTHHPPMKLWDIRATVNP